MTRQEKLDAFVRRLTDRPDVLAVIVFGSQARGDSRRDSDIDLLVMLSEGTRKVVEYYEGQAFEIIFTTEQEAAAYWDANKHDAVSFWEAAQILYETSGIGDRLRRLGASIRGEKRPALSPEEIAQARFDVDDTVRAAEGMAESDPSTATLLLNKKVAALIEVYFDLAQEWIPAPKQQLSILRKGNPEVARLLDAYLAASTVRSRIEEVKLLSARILQREP